MVSFRKSFLLLALLVMIAAVASAQQTPFSCVFNSGAPPIVRGEGLAEGMGEIVLRCSGGAPTPKDTMIPTVNIQVFLNVNITSKVTANPYTEAMLLLDEPGSAGNPVTQVACGDPGTLWFSNNATCPIVSRFGNGTGNYDASNTALIATTTPSVTYQGIRPNIWQGRCSPGSCNSATPSTIAFIGVPIDPPGTGPDRIIRIVNIRGNATQVPTSSSLLPSQILAVLSVSGQGVLPLPNNTGQVVALVQKGMNFSVGTYPPTPYPSGSSNNPPVLRQCVPQNKDAPGSAPNQGCYQVRVRFGENFVNAFKLQGGNGQNVPGAVYNTESLFTNNNLVGAAGTGGLSSAGRATQPTQLWGRLSGIPTGVRIFASRYATRVNTGFWESGGYTNSQVQGFLQNGASAYIPDPTGGGSSLTGIGSNAGTTLSTCGSTASAVWQDGLNNSPYYEVTVSASGTAAIGYDVGFYGADPLNISNIEVGLMVVYTANPLPAQGTATMSGNFAPVSTQGAMNTSANQFPRFADVPQSATAFTINTCATNILFPFLTNQAGFDSGISIANTSQDPFKTAPQTGICNLNYYGTFSSDASKTFYTQPTTAIAGGVTAVATLSGGGTNGIGAVAGFQGYMIATCNFQYAHGFAFISDFGATKLAQGYLALIMDDPSSSRTGTSSESLSN